MQVEQKIEQVRAAEAQYAVLQLKFEQDIRLLNRQLENSKDSQDRTKMENESLILELARHTSALENSQNFASALQGELQEQSAKVEELTDKLEISQRVASVQQEEMQSKWVMAEARYNAGRNSTAQLQEQSKAQAVELESFRNLNASLNGRVASANERVEELETELKSSRSAALELRGELQAAAANEARLKELSHVQATELATVNEQLKKQADELSSKLLVSTIYIHGQDCSLH